jgi:H+/Cl- antiporter ClcA
MPKAGEKIVPYLKKILKWIIISGVVGVVTGLFGSFFCMLINRSTELFLQQDWMIWLLPLAGLAIALLYKLAKKENVEGTDRVINIEKGPAHKIVMTPLISISTILTRLFGGSVGTEGAAIQLGGSLASNIGRIFRLDDTDRKIIIMCGISAGFASVVGTPVTAVALAIELAGVGVVFYSALLPCAVSAAVGISMTKLFGLEFERYTILDIPDMTAVSALQVAAVSAMCAVVAIFFCVALQKTVSLYKRFIPNHFIKALAGGTAIAVLSVLASTDIYSGDGMRMIHQSFSEISQPQDFALKTVFTALAIGAGFKGGEIVPSWAVGASFGNFAGRLMGLSPSFGAGIGLVAVFCGMVNCPLTAFILGIELFGGQGLLYFIIACALSYVLSGYYGLYPSQKIWFSKVRAEFINKNTE